MSAVDRVWGKFQIGDGCWEWTGAKFRLGYGQMRQNGRIVQAHRVMWSVANGTEIPDGLDILHRCDNPSCVSPAHLYAGTHRQNMIDREMRSRGNHPSGERHPNARLSAADAKAIKDRAAAGEQLKTIAAEFGVTPSCVSLIRCGKNWKDA